MKYMLDTNICIYIIKKKPEQVLKRLSKVDPSTIALSSITWSELIYGVEKSSSRERNLEALSDFAIPFEILPWTSTQAEIAGKIRADLAKEGKLIDHYDTQIASHALSLGLTLITNNEKEFKRIEGLKVENWVK